MKMSRKIFNALFIVMLVGSIGLTFFVIHDTFTHLDKTLATESSQGILASVNLSARSIVILPVTYWQQSADPCTDLYAPYSSITRQFEWSKCDYYSDHLDKGIVSAVLGEDSLPTPAYQDNSSMQLSGAHLASRGIYGDNFSRWFHSVDNLSTEKNSTLEFIYSPTEDSYSYESSNFYPVGDGLFTMRLAIPFYTTSDNSHFVITADDDTWVFVDDTLAIDLGGIHRPATGSFDLPESGTIYVFHANRDSAESAIAFKLVHAVSPAQNSAIAYDDSSYIAPLGESVSYTTNSANALITAAIIECIIFSMLIVFIPLAVRVALRRKK